MAGYGVAGLFGKAAAELLQRALVDNNGAAALGADQAVAVLSAVKLVTGNPLQADRALNDGVFFQGLQNTVDRGKVNPVVL